MTMGKARLEALSDRVRAIITIMVLEMKVPSYATKIEKGRFSIDLLSATKRKKPSHTPLPLARPVLRQAGPIRVVGISTTA